MIFVYSIDSASSIKELDESIVNFVNMTKGSNVVKILVGNKCDLDNDRRVSYEDLEELAEN